MTTEIEKTFFDTFGIEPKYESHSCDGWGRTVEIKYFTDKKEADKFGIVVSELVYPQITEHILFELIKMLTHYEKCLHLYKDIAGSIKDQILRKSIKNFELRPFYIEQVRTLFEEG